jgi:deferrochelatase/peroxidase EfeB
VLAHFGSLLVVLILFNLVAVLRGGAIHAEVKYSYPQPTVVSGGNNCGVLVTIRLKSGIGLKAVARVAAKLQEIVSEISSESEEQKAEGEGAVAGIGFSAAIWKELVKTSGGKLILPADINLAEYKTKRGPLGEMPATGGDLLLHIKAETVSLGFEIVKRVSDKYG